MPVFRVLRPSSLSDGRRRRTHPNRVTRPLEEAVMEPSSSMVYSAEMLSCRNRPSGSFFCRAYHLPAYCEGEEENSGSVSCYRLGAEPRASAGSLTLLGSKSSLTLKLSTMQEADRQRSTQARNTSSRATLEDSILRWRNRRVIISFRDIFGFPDMHMHGPAHKLTFLSGGKRYFCLAQT